MKWKSGKIIIVVSVIAVFISVIAIMMIRRSKESKENDLFIEMIHTYVQAVNEKDIDLYISLFEESIREGMREHIKVKGTDGFFYEDTISLIAVEKADPIIALSEKQRFGEVEVYKVTANIEYIEIPTTVQESLEGYVFNFVFVKQKNEWKLYRISG